MKIGNLTLQSNLFLAPMAGVTDRACREIFKPFVSGLMYTEMVSAKGLYYEAAPRVSESCNESDSADSVGSKKTNKTRDLLEMSEVERPLGVQIFGSEPEIMAEIVEKALSFSGDLLDINMGCPAPKIVNNGDGSALMKNPKLAAEIVRAVKRVSPVPVTAKIRAGWDSESITAVEFAKHLEDAGVDAITVHARTREQFYAGVADWSVVADVARAVSVPIIGNGDVRSVKDAAKKVELAGCAGAMIGRGAMGNPWIFTGEIASLDERLSVAKRHIELMIKYKGEYRAIKESRKVLGWYLTGIPNASKLRLEINSMETFADVERMLEKVKNRVGNL